jgi:hypothetical protein
MKIRDHATSRVWEIEHVYAVDEYGNPHVFLPGCFSVEDAASPFAPPIPPSGASGIQRLELGLDTHSACLDQIKDTIVILLARVAKLETTAGHFNP